MTIKHASIVPLIGGETLGQINAFGTRPEYLLSYSAFIDNDSHLVNYLKDVPYILLDQGGKAPYYVDVVNSVCPCAGLSSLSGYAHSDAAANEWMYRTTEYVLKEIKPKVFWGENAPTFAGKLGKPIVDKLHAIAKAEGYTMSIYRTKSFLHGLPQVRERSFYFFWKGNKVPLLNYYSTPIQTIEQLLDNIDRKSTQWESRLNETPSKHDPLYRYVLEELEGGITHKDFYNMITKTDNPMDWLERKGIKYTEVAQWLRKNNYDTMAERCERMHTKLESGGNIMRRPTMVPKDFIGAFVGHYPKWMTHYSEDRYITYRESMSIMGLPEDFELLQPYKFFNHVCQNVPVGTATDMANEIKAVLNDERDWLNGDLLYQYNASKRHELKDSSPPSCLSSFI